MEDALRAYFEACNSGEVARIAACLAADAVHYFPGDLFGGPCHGAVAIAEKTRFAVLNFGAFWTIDRIVCDPGTAQAATEWTLENRSIGTLLRGSEWYTFAANGVLQEVRAYLASPPHRDRRRHELGGFDYATLGYPPVSGSA